MKCGINKIKESDIKIINSCIEILDNHINNKTKMGEALLELLTNNIDIVIENYGYYYDGISINKMLFALESGYGEYLFKVYKKLDEYRLKVRVEDGNIYDYGDTGDILDALLCKYDRDNLIGDALDDYDTYGDYVNCSIDILDNKAIEGENNE